LVIPVRATVRCDGARTRDRSDLGSASEPRSVKGVGIRQDAQRRRSLLQGSSTAHDRQRLRAKRYCFASNLNDARTYPPGVEPPSLRPRRDRSMGGFGRATPRDHHVEGSCMPCSWREPLRILHPAPLSARQSENARDAGRGSHVASAACVSPTPIDPCLASLAGLEPARVSSASRPDCHCEHEPTGRRYAMLRTAVPGEIYGCVRLR